MRSTLLAVIVSGLFSGCANLNVFEGNFIVGFNEVRTLTKDSKIIVGINDDLGFPKSEKESINYVYSFVRALKERGFNNVDSFEDYNAEGLDADYFALINLSKDVKHSSDLSSINFLSDGKESIPTVIYPPEDQIAQYYLTITWVQKSKNTPFMATSMVLYESPCTDFASYKYIVYKTAEYLPVNKAKDFDFSEKLSSRSNCVIYNSMDFY